MNNQILVAEIACAECDLNWPGNAQANAVRLARLRCANAWAG